MTSNLWNLDPTIIFLNHGAFGACPADVLRRQTELRRQMEAEPVRFFMREMPPLLDSARRSLARWIGGRPEDVVFVRNATEGVNAVLRSLRFQPGDELLVTDHGYNACTNVARYVARRDGAVLTIAEVPTPIQSAEEVVQAVTARVTPRTRLALLDHVTSPTAVVFPIEELVRQLSQRGVDTLVDGAHAPGMVPLDVESIGATYYTGNLHKWACAPKGAAFLHVRADRQEDLQPAVISHGFNQSRPGYSPFQDAFDWIGTDDPTPWLCVPAAIEFLEGLVEGGLVRLMRGNRHLALAAREILCRRLELQPVCPEDMIGSIAAVRLPDDNGPAPEPNGSHRLNRELLDRFGIEVPVYSWPAPPHLMLRISAQYYNRPAQYERLADALAELRGG
jgi:isopenicillin-N epimerase